MNAESTHIKGSVEHTLRDQEVFFFKAHIRVSSPPWIGHYRLSYPQIIKTPTISVISISWVGQNKGPIRCGNSEIQTERHCI